MIVLADHKLTALGYERLVSEPRTFVRGSGIPSVGLIALQRNMTSTC